MKYLCLALSFLALLISVSALSKKDADKGLHDGLIFIFDQTSRREIKSITGAEASPFSVGASSVEWKVSYKIDFGQKEKLTELAIKNSLADVIESYLRNFIRLDVSVELISYKPEKNEITLVFIMNSEGK